MPTINIDLSWTPADTGDPPEHHNVRVLVAGVERHINLTPILMPQTTYSVSVSNVSDGQGVEATITPVNAGGAGVPLVLSAIAELTTPPEAPTGGTIVVTQV